jgi:hypothetical protein
MIMKVNNIKIQDNIYEKTEKLFLQHGIKGWNMDTVAFEAGMAKNTLYKIIGTKEQLLGQIIISKLKKNIETIVGIFQNEPDFLKAVTIGVRQLTHRISMDNPLMLAQVFREYPEIKERFDAIASQLSTSIHDYLNRAKKTGIVREDIDNDVLISSVTAVINHYLNGNFKGREFEEKVYKSLTYLLHGILK